MPVSIHYKQAFTLLELAMVLLIIGLVTAMAMTSGVSVLATARLSATEKKMQAIESALKTYRDVNDRLPCPASLTIAEGAANFGVEAATPGTCTGGTPAANFSAAGATNTSATGVEGALPVVTLSLPNDFMYDGWGHRFRYTVDRSVTALSSFPTIATGCNLSAITVNDANGTARSTGSIYSLLSHGENGHGGYTKNGVVTNAGSTNTDELTNCHCTSAAVAGTYAPTYVLKDSTTNPATITDSFDDLVLYKERWQMMAANEKPSACKYLYVADTGNNRIQIFTTAGGYVSQFGSFGSANGQFKVPMCLAFSGSTLYVVDKGNYRVQKFDSSGNFLGGIGAGYNGVAGAIGTSGSGNGQFGFYDYGAVCGLAIDTNGNVYVSDLVNHRVQKFDSNGNYVTKWGSFGSGDGQFNWVNGIGITSDGSILVADYNNYRIQKFTNTGTFISKFSTNAATRQPGASVVFDSAGNIHVGIINSFQIQKFDSAGTYLTTYCTYGSSDGLCMDSPNLSIDASDNVWVAEAYSNRVQKLTTAGAFVSKFGSAGSGNGQFNAPRFVVSSR